MKSMKIKTALLVGPCPCECFSVDSKAFVLFVDGGLKHQKTHYKKVKNYLSVGDQDSTSLKCDIVLNPNKDFSDLAFALGLLPRKINKIYFDGFFPALNLEKRLDHYLCNLGEVYHFVKKRRISAQLNSKMQFLKPGKNKLTLHGTFSIFSFESTKIKITGQAEYTLIKWTNLMSLNSKTLSNFAKGAVTFESPHPLLLIEVSS
jgi:thiamine pyrophosphokinase